MSALPNGKHLLFAPTQSSGVAIKEMTQTIKEIDNSGFSIAHLPA